MEDFLRKHSTQVNENSTASVEGTHFDSELICVATQTPDIVLLDIPLDEWVGESLYRFEDSEEKSTLLNCFVEAESDGFASQILGNNSVFLLRKENGYSLFVKKVAPVLQEEKIDNSAALTPRLLFNEKGEIISKNQLADQVARDIETIHDFFNSWSVVKTVPIERLWNDVKEGERPQYVQMKDDKGQEWTAELGFLKSAGEFEVRLHIDMSGFAQVENDVHLQTIAHDLRAPLANLQNILMLQDRLDDLEKKQQLQQKAHQSVKRLQSQLNNLLVHAAKEKEGLQKTFLKELWESVLADLSFLIEEAQPRLSAQFDVEHSFIEGTMLRSILQNLMSNSLKYRAKGRPCRISLDVYKQHDGLTIRMEDNGQGMDLENEKGLFNPFETLGQKSGTGVGLSLLKEKIERLGGKIQVRSQLDRGSIFLISIPEPSVDEQISLF